MVPEALQQGGPNRALTYFRSTVAKKVAACVPSLQKIAVRLPEDDTLWWRIQRGEGETKRNLVRISRDTGRRVEAYLHSYVRW